MEAILLFVGVGALAWILHDVAERKEKERMERMTPEERVEYRLAKLEEAEKQRSHSYWGRFFNR